MIRRCLMWNGAQFLFVRLYVNNIPIMGVYDWRDAITIIIDRRWCDQTKGICNKRHSDCCCCFWFWCCRYLVGRSAPIEPTTTKTLINDRAGANVIAYRSLNLCRYGVEKKSTIGIEYYLIRFILFARWNFHWMLVWQLLYIWNRSNVCKRSIVHVIGKHRLKNTVLFRACPLKQAWKLKN